MTNEKQTLHTLKCSNLFLLFTNAWWIYSFLINTMKLCVSVNFFLSSLFKNNHLFILNANSCFGYSCDNLYPTYRREDVVDGMSHKNRTSQWHTNKNKLRKVFDKSTSCKTELYAKRSSIKCDTNTQICRKKW